MAEKLDHGVVNLPLDKRGGGSLDAQIDRFKAGQQRDAKAQAKDKHARSGAAPATGGEGRDDGGAGAQEAVEHGAF